MEVAELWRYPVKSMAGESLTEVQIGPDGIPGDRSIHVVDGRGELVTARTRPALLGLHATLSAAGEVLVDDHDWRDPAVSESVEAAADPGARLAPSDGGHRHDDTPLLIATDGAVEWLGVDRRRCRPNVLIAGVDGLAEREWPGRELRIGGATISVEKLCARCVVTTLDPDTTESDPGVLVRINAELDGLFALNCRVDSAGTVRVGDPVELA